MGRLGNQMFQFASTLGIADMINSDVRFPIENSRHYLNNGPFDTKSGRNMDVKCDLLDCFNGEIEKYFIESNLIETRYQFNENGFEYDPSVSNINQYTNLNGYYQTELYFNQIQDIIRKVFNFKNEYKYIGNAIYDSINNPDSKREIISMHIRRGDYVLYPDHHPTCNIDYYKNAIKIINDSSESHKKILIFSDDKEWCRDNFIGEEYIISENDNPYIDLYLMTLCDHHIIANSSFSWWGAWLNPNANKIVVAPSRWFGPAIIKNTSDVYCKNWKII